eukprot:g62848.t1
MLCRSDEGGGLEEGAGEAREEHDNKVELTEEEFSDDSESEDEAGVEAEPHESDALSPSELFSSARWVKGDPPATPLPEFDGERRFNPNYDTGDAASLTLIFSQYVSMPMIDRWMEWSNTYARQRRNQKGGGQIRYVKPVCPNEMLAFVCIHIAMGAQQLKRHSDFWRSYVNPLVQYPDLTPIMTEKRFIDIKLIFQPNDPTLKKKSSDPDYDRLHHVRPFWENLNEVSKTMMSLGQFVSADEALIPFRGRSFMRVYMKDKPGKYGFKVYQANDPESGFAYHLKVYAGAQTLTPVQQSGNGARSTSSWRCSLLLCHELHRKYEQYLIGTIMANRLYGAKDVLDEIKAAEPRGTMNSCYMQDGPPAMVARWKDRRVCTFVSSVQGGALDHVQRIVDSKGNREAINTYAFVKLYNQYMGGTDTQDRLRLGSGAERVRRAVKPWYKLFLGLLDTAVTNTTIVYKGLLLQREHSEDVSIPSRHQMIEKLLSLLEKHIRKVKARDLDETEDELDEDGVLRSGVIRRDRLCDGMLEQVSAAGWGNTQQEDGKRRGKHPSHCVLCRRAGHRKRSSFYCSKCRLVLCRYPCFKNHQYLNVRASGRFKRVQNH